MAMKDLTDWGSNLFGQASTALAPAAGAVTATASSAFRTAANAASSGASAVRSSFKENLGGFVGASHSFRDASGNERVVTEVALIAEGGFGAVQRVRDQRGGGKEYALKKIRCMEGLTVASSLAAAKREAEVLSDIPPHPSIIRCYGFVIDPVPGGGQVVKILLELCTGGHLLEYMDNKNGKLGAREMLEPFAQVVDAVRHLHAQRPPIQHRDLKVENVLQDGSGQWKLCDFGSCSTERVPAKELSRERFLNLQEDIDKTVTMLYRPPEMADISMNAMKGYAIGEAVDLWMLGCILYTLAFYRHPFQDNASPMAIMNARYFIPEDHQFARSTKLCGLIHWLLAADPNDRPTATKLVEVLRNLGKTQYEELFAMFPAGVQEKIQRLEKLFRARKPSSGNAGEAELDLAAVAAKVQSASKAKSAASETPKAASKAASAESPEFDLRFALAGQGEAASPSKSAGRPAPEQRERRSSGAAKSNGVAPRAAPAGPAVDLLELDPVQGAKSVPPATAGFDDLLGFNSEPAAAPAAATPPARGGGSAVSPVNDFADFASFTAVSTPSTPSGAVGTPANANLLAGADWSADFSAFGAPAPAAAPVAAAPWQAPAAAAPWQSAPAGAPGKAAAAPAPAVSAIKPAAPSAGDGGLFWSDFDAFSPAAPAPAAAPKAAPAAASTSVNLLDF
mmetsp:Transcript_38025/g.70743  ORF Transcript_38025/g.70743 Transcript_38025/m.70743 type:complete len:680 (+) Transcript_38025:140-2179(+)